jgi:CheY-like chemotaxis protein
MPDNATSLNEGMAKDAKPAESKKRILLVEDDSNFIGAIQHVLEVNDYEVQCAANGVEGLKHVMVADYDIILCDLMMPHLPGDMFFEAVKRTKPQLCSRFIFMSGYKGEQKYDDFIRKIRGVALWKPFSVSDMLQSIDLILHSNAR